MNILFLLKTFDLGGLEVVTATLVNRFTKLGHNVYIFAFEKGSGMGLSLFDGLTIEIGYDYSYKRDNISKLKQLIDDNNIQVVINQWGLPFIPIKTLIHAVDRRKIKIISFYHNDPSSNGLLKGVEIELSRTKNLIKKLLLKTKWYFYKTVTSYSMRYVYNHSDRYMILSKSFIDNFKSFTGIKNPCKLRVQTNPVTIDSSDFIFDSTQKSKEIIYVGRLDNNQKRVFRVINTWALLEEEYQEWKLTIVGDGPERDDLESLVESKGLSRVAFEGFKNPKSYYERASILLLTSEYEGFPLVLAECMSYGVVPIVYGSYSAVYDIIEDKRDGFIIPKHKGNFSSTKMAEQLKKIMEDKDLLYSMQSAAIKKSKNYSLDIISDQWEELFKIL